MIPTIILGFIALVCAITTKDILTLQVISGLGWGIVLLMTAYCLGRGDT